MERLRSRVIVGLALAVALAAAPLSMGMGPVRSAEAAPISQAGVARVRFVNATGGPSGLNAYADGRLWAEGVRQVVGYLDAPSGERTFSFRLPGRSDDLASVAVRLKDGDRVTIAAMNTLDKLQAAAIPDDVSATPRNVARIKIVHAVPDAGPVTVTVDGKELVHGLAYTQVSADGGVFGGDHTLDVLGSDESTLAQAAAYSFVGNHAYTVFVTGTLASGQPALLFAESSVLKPDASTQFSFANMAQGTGPLDFYINDESLPLFPSVAFSRVTTAYATGHGVHRIDLYPAGADPAQGKPLATATLELGSNVHALFVAYGTARTLKVLTYTTDLGPLPPNASRLHMIHAAAGNPAIQVETLDGTELFSHVTTEGDAVRVVPAGSYNLRFNSTTNGERMMEKTGFQVLAGTLTLLIACDNDPGSPLMNAVMVSVENVPQYAAVRWAQFDAGESSVDLYLDGTRVAAALAYSQVTDFALLTPEVHKLAVYRAGSDPSFATPLVEQSLVLARTNSPRTVFLLETPGGPLIDVVPDQASLLPPGKARVRFFNAAPGMDVIGVANAVDNAALVDNLAFGEASNYLDVTPEGQAFNFVAGGVPLASTQALALQAGSVYTVVLSGVQPDLKITLLVNTP